MESIAWFEVVDDELYMDSIVWNDRIRNSKDKRWHPILLVICDLSTKSRGNMVYTEANCTTTAERRAVSTIQTSYFIVKLNGLQWSEICSTLIDS